MICLPLHNFAKMDNKIYYFCFVSGWSKIRTILLYTKNYQVDKYRVIGRCRFSITNSIKNINCRKLLKVKKQQKEWLPFLWSGCRKSISAVLKQKLSHSKYGTISESKLWKNSHLEAVVPKWLAQDHKDLTLCHSVCWVLQFCLQWPCNSCAKGLQAQY